MFGRKMALDKASACEALEALNGVLRLWIPWVYGVHAQHMAFMPKLLRLQIQSQYGIEASRDRFG